MSRNKDIISEIENSFFEVNFSFNFRKIFSFFLYHSPESFSSSLLSNVLSWLLLKPVSVRLSWLLVVSSSPLSTSSSCWLRLPFTKLVCCCVISSSSSSRLSKSTNSSVRLSSNEISVDVPSTKFESLGGLLRDDVDDEDDDVVVAVVDVVVAAVSAVVVVVVVVVELLFKRAFSCSYGIVWASL